MQGVGCACSGLGGGTPNPPTNPVCRLRGIDDLYLWLAGNVVWNAMKPCVNKHLRYMTDAEVYQLWTCNVTPWRVKTRQVLSQLLSMCPGGFVPYGVALPTIPTLYPAPTGTFTLDAGLARQVTNLANAQGYSIHWSATLFVIHRIYVSM